ncbi:hypothetical protein PENSPDRAFT_692425 [Peniophora sp. CONT]|nr:hypothetical protein PENSPDRAFT_692425 [Peniophora sp. CONT]
MSSSSLHDLDEKHGCNYLEKDDQVSDCTATTLAAALPPDLEDSGLTNGLRDLVHQIVADEARKLESCCADRFDKNVKSIDAVVTGIDASDEQNRDRLDVLENQIRLLRSGLRAVIHTAGMCEEGMSTLKYVDDEATLDAVRSTCADGGDLTQPQKAYIGLRSELVYIRSIVEQWMMHQCEDRASFTDEINGLSHDMVRLFERFQEFETDVPPAINYDLRARSGRQGRHTVRLGNPSALAIAASSNPLQDGQQPSDKAFIAATVPILSKTPSPALADSASISAVLENESAIFFALCFFCARLPPQLSMKQAAWAFLLMATVLVLRSLDGYNLGKGQECLELGILSLDILLPVNVPA